MERKSQSEVASCGSKMVEHSTPNPKVKGSSPVADPGPGKEKWCKSPYEMASKS